MIRIMNNLNLNYLINFFVIVVLFASCSKETDDVNGKKPDDDIEAPIFDGYAKNLKSYPGHNRVKITFESSSDSIEYFVLSWDNKNSETVTKTINKSEVKLGIYQVFVNDLIEGNYSFKILAYDKDKNPAKSSATTRAQVYGENYINTLHTRVIRDAIFLFEKDPILEWLDARPEEVAVDIYYTNETGNPDTIRMAHTEKTITLPGHLEKTEIKYRSLYLPINTSIDTFYTASSTLHPKLYYASVATKNFIEKSNLVNEVTSESATTLYDGLEYSTLGFVDPSNRPQSAFILMVDLSKGNLTVSSIMPNNDTKFAIQTVKDMAEHRNKVGNKVLAAVNADFYRTSGEDLGTPAGPVVIDGTIVKDYSGWWQSKTYFAIKKDGKPEIGPVSSLTQQVYENMENLIGGGDWLVNNGVKTAIVHGIHPRTCVGYTRDDVVYFVLVDGRRAGYAVGLDLVDMSNIMFSLGASHACNLDGGGSSTMVLKEESGSFKVVNRHSDAYPRRVANGLAIMIK